MYWKPSRNVQRGPQLLVDDTSKNPVLRGKQGAFIYAESPPEDRVFQLLGWRQNYFTEYVQKLWHWTDLDFKVTLFIQWLDKPSTSKPLNSPPSCSLVPFASGQNDALPLWRSSCMVVVQLAGSVRNDWILVPPHQTMIRPHKEQQRRTDEMGNSLRSKMFRYARLTKQNSTALCVSATRQGIGKKKGHRWIVSLRN